MNTNIKKSKHLLVIVAMLVVAMFMSTYTVTAYANSSTGNTPTKTVAEDGDKAFAKLISEIYDGEYIYRKTGKHYNFTTKQYKLSGGGTAKFNDLISNTGVKQAIVYGSSGDWTAGGFLTEQFTNLKQSSKKQFLSDLLTLANAVAADTAAGFYQGEEAPTDDTVNDLIEILQSETGMGTALLAQLLQDTKPDFVTANRLYQPFSGVVGTILGIISILIMALLGITMALDLAFITIPAMRLMFGADGKGEGGKDDAKLMSRIISQEARKAVELAENGDGGGGQGEGKQALGIYFKKRWKGLLLLGICLLYLVQGQIYSLVGWIIDLLSGFIS